MADVEPLRALRYDLDRAGPLGDLVAPPYDVIDAAGRAELVARSARNAVELDLPLDADGGDRYEHAARVLAAWIDEGVLVNDDEPAIWALEQGYTGPDREDYRRRGFLCRVRVTEYGPGLVRPHERTQPGPKQDRLDLTRATKHNLSPIFSLYPGEVWSLIDPALDEPWGEATDADGTTNRVWRVADPETVGAVTSRLAAAELLIADGHHRYETARAYADEVGGEGDHRYTLMCLVSLDDPGLAVFGYHRLLGGFTGTERPERLADALREHFEIEEVDRRDLDPAGAEGAGVFGYIDSHLRRAFRLRLRDTTLIDELLADHSQAYRRLDAAILEELVLKRALGMTAEDVEAKRGVSYAKSVAEALDAIDDDGDHQVAFLLRPTPVGQVRDVVAAGETMPPKSTFFFPKVPTGIVFNPLGR
jgi:uncharacterized protein (DUF1015 family)